MKGSWGRRVGGSEPGAVDGTGSGTVGTSRPATNITGANCTNSSGGYEFIVLHVRGASQAW